MARVRGSMTEGLGSELPRMMPSKNEWMSHAPRRMSSAHFSKSQISQIGWQPGCRIFGIHLLGMPPSAAAGAPASPPGMPLGATVPFFPLPSKLVFSPGLAFLGLKAQPPPGADVSGASSGRSPQPSSQPTSPHPAVEPSARGCMCWWSRITCSQTNMSNGAKRNIMKILSLGMTVISLSSACGKTTVSARPISNPVTEHRMSGLLLMDVPWYTSIRPTVRVTIPTITLSASGGHGPPASQKA
mmetsp:Transcript_73580/g.177573  ORF Transcript_73580/g.177573 Transcript_73580/m.177573 type:complete len:243 (-) Transcript_73580:119-847(-)